MKVKLKQYIIRTNVPKPLQLEIKAMRLEHAIIKSKLFPAWVRNTDSLWKYLDLKQNSFCKIDENGYRVFHW